MNRSHLYVSIFIAAVCTPSPAFAATVAYVGQENDVRELRTTTVPKQFDPDGNNVYGEDGYVFYAVDDPPSKDGPRFISGDPLTVNPSPFTTLASIPSYLGLTSIGQRLYAVGGYDQYPLWDRISEPPDVVVADVKGGLALHDDVNKGTEAPVVDITVLGALPPAGVRIGVYLLFTGNDFIASARLDTATGTTAAATMTSVAHFFDLTAATVGEKITLHLKASERALNPNVSYVGLTFDALPPSPTVNLNVAAVPETTGLPVTPEEIRAAENLYAWDRFAWQTFIALNWPAIEPSAQNGYLRGFPDLSDPATINFVNAGTYDGPVVWETFFEKREMFDADATTADDARPAPWSSPFSKRVYGSAKFTTLDETVEVLAEALEGYGTHRGMPAVARVFRGTQADDSTALRYEVKVNYDFYKYVVDNGLYFDPAALARSQQQPPVQLPWRTSLSAPGVEFLTQKPAETSYVDGYRVASTLAAYQAGAAAAARGRGGALPPRIGAVHLKAAWAPIEEAEKPRFLWREAEYFTGVDKKPQTGLFGLVGLHIIQRLMVQAPQNLLNNAALGGTFIFSTWEHTDIKETPGGPGTQYTYTNYFEKKDQKKKDQNNNIVFYADPDLSNPFYVYRLYPILDHTQAYNQAVWAAVGANSVWSNYRLVGTQFVPVDIENDGPIANDRPGPNAAAQPNLTTNWNDPTGLGQPVYLSNLAIETNLGLQQFQGQPPGLDPVPQFSGSVSANDGNTFLRTSRDHLFGNLRFGTSRSYQDRHMQPKSTSAYNMGGCMGCHGVAQLNGFSFSFVLLGGQAGADPDAEGIFFAAPISNPTSKGIQLLRAGQHLQLQPFRAPAGSYLANQGGRAVVTGTRPMDLTLQAADGRVAGSPFRFGDGVTLQDADGNYLTAQTAVPPIGPSPVVFSKTMTPASVWYLEDPSDPGSTGDVLRLDELSFLNAVVTYPNEDPPRLPRPALLSTYPPTPDGSVTTVAQVGIGVRERWNVLKTTAPVPHPTAPPP